MADTQTKPLQRQETKVEPLVTSPVQQETVQPAQTLLALSPARQQAVHDGWQQAAQPLYQALRPQFEAVQQIQDPTQRRMTEAALERPFFLLWQEAARRQIAPVFEGLERQSGGKASRLLAEAAAGRFFDLLWEEMKGRSAESGGAPGIALLESEVISGVADGDTTALRGVVSGRLPEKGAGGDAAGIAEIDKPYPVAAGRPENASKPLQTQTQRGIIQLDLQRFSNGKLRAEKYAFNWQKANLEGTIKRLVPDARASESTTGKIIYSNDSSYYSIIYDVEGDYFRIEDKRLTGKRRYVDLNGNNVANIREKGKERGRTKDEYEQATHFKNDHGKEG